MVEFIVKVVIVIIHCAWKVSVFVLVEDAYATSTYPNVRYPLNEPAKTLYKTFVLIRCHTDVRSDAVKTRIDRWIGAWPRSGVVALAILLCS
ncbi:unnamed protein product [Sphenostylis stenocarpa]|uniref:Uncharacterized protein n=1 Tax=Sphenostylis stenocarpa TaxID=92480 RepID=A0AA86VJG7_9FABA|nr:unnamed protein product [Sphenostylis stenocarpa]